LYAQLTRDLFAIAKFLLVLILQMLTHSTVQIAKQVQTKT